MRKAKNEPRTPLSEFIEILINADDAFQVASQALSIIAPIYGIVRVEGELISQSRDEDGEQESGEQVWYETGADFDRTDGVHLGHELVNQQVMAMLTVYHDLEHEMWTVSEKQKIMDMMNILTLAFSKTHLINTLRLNSLTDSMTKLPNSAGFTRKVSELYKEGILITFNALYFNLRSFGLVNRRFGKDETDDIMCRYASKLNEFIEKGEYVARLGGDNFVALIFKERTEEFLNHIAGVETYGIIGEEEIPIVISAVAGVRVLDKTDKNSDDILGKCSVALQVAKNVEKLPFVYATSELNTKVFKRKQIIEEFPAAIAAKEFKVFYQPKVDTTTNAIVGAEALIRWLSGGKIIPPKDFVPIIEKDGSICDLDFYVLENVCCDIRSWMEKGIKPVRISTNFSRKNLSQPNFATRILETLAKYEIPREYIEIEITETTDESENGLLSSFMKLMHDEKISTAIDDFGTGYTSLNVLSDFSVDVLKIDKSFIDKIKRSGKESVVLTNVVKMAKELDMTIINEGVENWEQVDFLKGLGSNVVQGFLFDKPLPEESFQQRLKIGKYERENPPKD